MDVLRCGHGRLHPQGQPSIARGPSRGGLLLSRDLWRCVNVGWLPWAPLRAPKNGGLYLQNMVYMVYNRLKMMVLDNNEANQWLFIDALVLVDSCDTLAV